MKKKPISLLQDTGGGISLVAVGFLFFFVLFGAMLTEMLRLQVTVYRIETALTRSLTAAVETNLDYRYRSDRLLCLYIDAAPPAAPNGYESDLEPAGGAWADFQNYLEDALACTQSGSVFSDASGAWSVTVTAHGGDDRTVCAAPVMWIRGVITVAPIWQALPGASVRTIPFTYTSQNFREE